MPVLFVVYMCVYIDTCMRPEEDTGCLFFSITLHLDP